MEKLKAKALLLTSSFLPGFGGIERYLAGLCDQLKPDMAVMAQPKRGKKLLPTDLPYPVRALPHNLAIPDQKVVESATTFMHELGTTKLLFGTSVPLGLLGPRFSKRNVQYAVMMHGSELWTIAKVPIINRKLAKALAGAQKLFSVSHYTAGKAAELLKKFGYAVPPTQILPVFVDTNTFKPITEEQKAQVKQKWGIKPEQPLVLHLSRLYRRKGSMRLVKAWEDIQMKHPEAVLMIAGTGNELNRLKRMVKRRPHQRIILAGNVASNDIAALYAAADIFAFPAHPRWWGTDTEGLGIVMLEAAAAGTPTVVGKCGGTVESLVDGQTGYLIDGSNLTQVSDRINVLLTDPAKAKQMGEAGRTWVQQTYGNPGSPKPIADWLNA